MAAESIHLLNITQGGTLAPSGELVTRPADVEALFATLRDTRARHLVIYVHGGLVSEYRGRVEAARLRDHFTALDGVQPLFVLWESSWQETIARRMQALAQDPVVERLLRPLQRLLTGRLRRADEEGARGEAELSAVELAQFLEADAAGTLELSTIDRSAITGLTPLERAELEQLLRDDQDVRTASAFVEQAIDAPVSQGSIQPAGAIDEGLLKHMRDETEGARSAEGALLFFAERGVRILLRSLQRFRSGTDHGIRCTLVEETLRTLPLKLGEVGPLLWSAMKQDLHAAFGDNAGRSGEQLYGGTYLLENLARALAEPGGAPLRVSLIGHSAGSIFICALLDKARALLPSDFRFAQIVFLAPAVDFELCRRAVADHPDCFERLTLYTMADQDERRDAIAGPFYPRSLLYLVSGLLEGERPMPLVGLERYLGADPPHPDQAVAAVRALLSGPQGRLVISGDDSPESELSCLARHHGVFPECATMWRGLAQLLRV